VDQVNEALAPLALHELILGMIADRDSFGSRIIPWDNALLLILPTLVEDTHSTSSYSVSLMLDGLLITHVQSASEELGEFTKYLGTGIKLFKPTTSALVCAQLLFQNHLRVQRALAVRNRATSLMETLEKDPETVTVGDIMDLRSQISVMDADAEDQIYCIELMGPMDSPAFSVKGIEDYYQTLLINSRC
jgi:hypothetical protein